MCVFVFLLQQSPHRASFRGQSAWGGRMVLTGYVTHDFVVMHHKHCLKKMCTMSLLVKQKNKKGGMQANYRKQCMINTHSLKRSRVRIHEISYFSNQSNRSGLEEKTSILTMHTHRNSVNPKKKSAKQKQNALSANLPSHFSDIPHSLSHFSTHTL